jgi:hypothetical protein
MSRWVTPKMAEQIVVMIGKEYPRARIRAAFHITDGQLNHLLKRMNLKIKKDNWGMREIYFDLQGRKR